MCADDFISNFLLKKYCIETPLFVSSSHSVINHTTDVDMSFKLLINLYLRY